MDIELWKRIKKERKLTLKDISDLSNIPKRTVDDIFSGKTTNPRSDTVDAIEKALGISNEQDYNLSPKGKELVNLLMGLDDKQLEDALSVIKIIAKK
jgi:transcriptional regulator with XRE-family HTH domain